MGMFNLILTMLAFWLAPRVQTTSAYADWAFNVPSPANSGPTVAWDNPLAALSPDGAAAVCRLDNFGAGGTGDSVLATWFADAFAEIPDCATIHGIELTVRIRASLNTGDPANPSIASPILWDDFWHPMRFSGSLVALQSGAGSTVPLTTEWQDLTWGGPTDVGSTGVGEPAVGMITPAYIKQHCWLGVYASYDDAIDIYLDSVRLKVYWSEQ